MEAPYDNFGTDQQGCYEKFDCKICKQRVYIELNLICGNLMMTHWHFMKE